VNFTAGLLLGGVLGFFVARLQRAIEDVKGAVDNLANRIGQRPGAALRSLVMFGAIALALWTKGVH
jgi:hypothetical protein